MTHSSWAVTAATVLAFCAVASPAAAKVTGQAKLTLFPVELIDLDPLDGIAPSLTWGPSETSSMPASSVGGYVSVGNPLDVFNPPDVFYQDFREATPFAALQGSASKEAGSASSSISHLNGQAGGFVLDSQGEVAVLSPGQQGSLSAGAWLSAGFTLTPHTAVIFKTQFEGHALIDPAVDLMPGTYPDSVRAKLLIQAKGPGTFGHGQQDAVDELGVFADAFNGNQGSVSRMGGVSFVNASAAALTGAFTAEAQVMAYTMTPAVPEPETWGLATAGVLGVLATRVGRNRKRGLPQA